MKISVSIEQLMNKQINAELYSAYMYLSMAAYFESKNLEGFSYWMKLQAKEEMDHAMKFYQYIHERGGSVTLTGIQEPPAQWKSPLDAFTKAYEHEKHVTELIHTIYTRALKEHDHASTSFLLWFIDEQVEEEASADQIVQKLSLIGSHKSSILMLDRELANRKEE